MRHKYLTPWQCLGYAVQWWDGRKTLDKRHVYTASIQQVSLGLLYCVKIQAPWGNVFDFYVHIDTGRWSMLNPEQYHYRFGVLGLYKSSDMRQMFLWARRVMERSTAI